MSRIRANTITNQNANGAPNFPDGLTVTGVITSTTINANVTGDLSVTGNIGVGGTVTYEDVTNVDSIGIITARAGINVVGNDLNVGSNIKIGNASGIITATSYRGDASQMTGAGLGTDGSANTSGIVTASSFVSTAGQFFAERNKLINGEFRIMQRGDVASSTDQQLENLGGTAVNYTADHWQLYCQNTGARFQARRFHGEHPDGFGNSFRISCTTADTSLASNEEVQFFQKIEGFDTQDFAKGTSSAKQYTLSFYAKSTKTGTYICRLLGRHNTNRCVSASYTISDTNWNRYVITFPADTNTVDNSDATEALRVVWWLVAGSGVNSGSLQTTWTNSTDTGAATGQVNFADSTSNIFYLAGCQLEVGPVATPFERRKYNRDLEDCYRYYRRWKAGVNGVTHQASGSSTIGGSWTNDPAAATTIAQGSGIDADDAMTCRWLNPPMNHAPTVENHDYCRLATGGNMYDNGTTIQRDTSTPDQLNIHWDNEGGMGGSGTNLRLILKNASGNFAIEAEI